MRAMKDSGIEWIGAIPQDWELRKIKTNFDIIAGATPKSGEASFWDGDIPWITPADYTTEGVYVSAGHKSITQDGLNSCATSLIPEGSIIFSKRAPVGLVAINSNPLCTNQGCLSCVPKDSVDAKYFYYVMSIYGEQFDLFASGTTFKEISADAFANFKLPYPDSETQKQIASFLDTKCAEIYALIAAKEKTNALLKERRQSIIYEAVTKGLDPTVPMKGSGVEWIGEIPERWDVLPLKHCIKSIESGTSVNAEDRPCQSDEKGVLKTSCVYSGVFDSSENKAVIESEYNRLSCPVKKNTVIVSRMNTADLVGACGYVDCDYDNVFLPDRLWMVSFKENCLAKYMWYFLSSRYAKSYYASTCTGTSGSMQNISQDQFGQLRFLLPTLTEQVAIVDELDRQNAIIDALICTNDREIQRLKEYRQSLIYEAVTGKIEV